MKSVILNRAEMHELRSKGFTGEQSVCLIFKRQHDLNFLPKDLVDINRFIFEELADKTGWKVTFLEGGAS
jgi:hypothetical protein